MARRLILAAAVLAFAPALLAQQFTYNAAAIPAGPNIWTDGIAIVDVNGDGANDLVFADGAGYATGTAVVQRLYTNGGAGLFADSSAALNVANFGARMVIAEDFDNDGDPDLLYSPDSVWPNPNKKPVLLLNNGNGTFVNASAGLPAVNLSSFCVCAGDVDNDGDLDVVFTDGATFGGANAQAKLFLNNGAAAFVDVTGTHLPVDLFRQQDVTLLDIDEDFDIDIAIMGKGPTHVYLNDGTGHFTMSAMANAVGTSGSYEVDWADLDADGDFDAAVQSIAGFAEGWARNDGTGVPMVKTTFTNSVSQDDNEMAMLDYDNDGDLDVFVGSLATSERVYNNNNAVFTLANGVIQAVGDSSLDLGFGDLNNDGKYDMVTAQGESGVFVNKVYMNNGSADTLAPVFMNVETPAAIGGATTVFRAQVRDQYADDGHIGVTMTYSYTTVGAGSGSGTATPMGNGLFRAAVPTSGATSVSLTWTATDRPGNASVNGPIVVSGGGGAPWTDEGRALAGVSGDPSLVGTGTLLSGSAGALTLGNAAPSAPVILFLATSSSPVPFKGGTLCAFPDIASLVLATGGSGGLALPWASWPTGLSGLSLWFQFAIDDAAAIHGVSLSNTVRGDVP